MAAKNKTKEYLQTGIDLARKASQIVWTGWKEMKKHTNESIETKLSAIDFVTEYDKKVEEFLFAALKEKYPDHLFIGEETTSENDECELTDTPTWVIDPIDGTTNFIHTFPCSAICIGLMINKQVEVGIVYHVAADHMYTARRGCGAYCNGQKLVVSRVDALSNALVCAEFGGSQDPKTVEVTFDNMRKIKETAHGLRMLGSAALNMCMVANGGADSYFEFGIHVWDMAAASIIITEAGGVLLDPLGGPVDLMSRQIVCAGTMALAKEICGLVTPIKYKRDGK